MHLESNFVVDRSRDEVVRVLELDETLNALLPGRSEVIARGQNTKSLSTLYSALGRDGTAIFHFCFLPNGDVTFEKECDGVVWRELVGKVRVTARGSRSSVSISMKGATKPLVPEFAVKGPMEEQLLQMAEALEALL